MWPRPPFLLDGGVRIIEAGDVPSSPYFGNRPGLELEADHRRHARRTPYATSSKETTCRPAVVAANWRLAGEFRWAHGFAGQSAGEQISWTGLRPWCGTRPARHVPCICQSALGNPVSRPDPAASHSTPNLTAPVGHAPNVPGVCASPVRERILPCPIPPSSL